MRNYACSAFTTALAVEEWGCSCLVEESEVDVTEQAIDAASDVLVILSGFRVTGPCTKTVRPISSGVCGFPHGGRHDSIFATPLPYNGIPYIPLRGPNTDVVGVKVDGVALADSDFGLFDGQNLFFRSGRFPSANNLLLADTEAGTWSITFSFGNPIDFITQCAASELACVLAAALLGKKSTLPPGVVSANIQGASVVVDQEARDDPGSLPAVARFLDVYAPNGRNVSGVIFPGLDQGWTLVEVS